MPEPVFTFDISTFEQTVGLAEALSLFLRPGDTLAVSGELGTGKTTLIRALLQAFCDQAALEVPSPTFTLAQAYDGAGFRFPLTHADFYRLKSPDEVYELGLDEALEHGALLIEWPEKAPGLFETSRADLRLNLEGDKRSARLSSKDEAINLRLARLSVIDKFLKSSPCAGARRRFLQGDASPRAYERLHMKSGGTAVLLNALAQPDRSVGVHRLNYMKVTHLAPNEAIAPILAIGNELRRRGLCVPRHLRHDIDQSLLLQEDLGDSFIAQNGAPVPERYEAAIDVLVHMHTQEWPAVAKSPEGAMHEIPDYSREAFQTEARLFLEFFLPLLNGAPAQKNEVQDFEAAFDDMFDQLSNAPHNWTLFDFHSPNVMWLEERVGIERVGLLDFQDTRCGPEAYDLVSLTQDARVSVSMALEQALLERYLKARLAKDKTYDVPGLKTAYAICGAQRATRILGVFARLAYQDAKLHYLKHIPRVSDYLDRCLTNPVTHALKEWFAVHAPAHARSRAAALAA
jgi:tRNA threonylcarbamoyl adenosine modification protein YjeE